jgi:hypothetical protein
MTIDRAGIRDEVVQKLLGVSALADDLQIDPFEGNAESDEGKENWFDQFLQAERGGIAVSYAGSQEVETEDGRAQEPVLVLLLYTRYEKTALTYLDEMEAALDGDKVTAGGNGYFIYWAADNMTGGEEGYYEYEVQLRLEMG